MRNSNAEAVRPPRDVVLIFDMDGTLLDARDAVIDAVGEGLDATYQHFDLPVPRRDRRRIAAAIGLPTPDFYREACDLDTVPEEIQDRFIGEFEVRSTRSELAALQRGETDLYAGAEEALSELAARGHPLSLISNANAPYFEAVVAVHRLRRFFSETLSLELAMRRRLARSKAGIVRHIADRFPGSVVIGDRVHDIEAGRRAGARTVGCLYGFGAPEEFARADWTIRDPRELLALPLAAPAPED